MGAKALILISSTSFVSLKGTWENNLSVKPGSYECECEADVTTLYFAANSQIS